MDNQDHGNDHIDDQGIISEKLYSLLLRCSHALSRGHHHHHGGMHPSQWRLLFILSKTDEIAQRELVEVLQVRPGSLSELLNKLESKGLIIREKKPDNKRHINVRITELGRTAIKDNELIQRQTAQDLFSSLSMDEQHDLVQILEKLVNLWHDRNHNHEHKHHRCHVHEEGARRHWHNRHEFFGEHHHDHHKHEFFGAHNHGHHHDDKSDD